MRATVTVKEGRHPGWREKRTTSGGALMEVQAFSKTCELVKVDELGAYCQFTADKPICFLPWGSVAEIVYLDGMPGSLEAIVESHAKGKK